MNVVDYCREEPVILRKKGDYVAVRSHVGESIMHGSLARDVTTSSQMFIMVIEGTDSHVALLRSDWDISLLAPPVEDGIYVGMGSIYRVRQGEIRGTDVSMKKNALHSLFTIKAFAEKVAEGRVRRVAELSGTW